MASGYFGGEFKRRPTQALGGASNNQRTNKDEIINQIHENRRLRELEKKKKDSVVPIQATVRGFLARRRTALMLRQEFDQIIAQGINVSTIHSLLTRFAFFYKSPDDDARLRVLSENLLKSHEKISESVHKQDNHAWNKTLAKLLIANLRLLQTTGSSHHLPLRLVEVYALSAGSDLWVRLINLGYFKILEHIIVSRCPEIQDETFKPPTPLAETLMELIRKPFESCIKDDEKVIVINEMANSFFNPSNPASMDCRIYYMVRPIVATYSTNLMPSSCIFRSFRNDTRNYTLWKIHFVATVLTARLSQTSRQDIGCFLLILRDMLFKTVLDSHEQKIPLSAIAKDDDSDSISFSDSETEEEQMDLCHGSDVMKRLGIETLFEMINNEKMVMAMIEAVEGLDSIDMYAAISRVSYVMQVRDSRAIHKSPLLYKQAFRPMYIRKLWQMIVVFSEADGHESSIKKLASAKRMHKSVSDDLFPLLSSFCQFFAHLLPTIYESEFYQDEPVETVGAPITTIRMMPFSISELATIALQLRDIVVGLIDLSFPTVYPFTPAPPPFEENVHLWLTLFNSIVPLLQQLHSRDTRKKFRNAWMIERPMITDTFTNDSLEVSYVERKPFVHFNKTVKQHPADHGLRVHDIRNLTLLQELPFIVPFEARLRVFQELIRHGHQIRDMVITNEAFQLTRIRRSHLYEDAFEKCTQMDNASLKNRLKVSLVNTAGIEEAGIDGGGIVREFLSELLKTAFDVNRGFFKTTSDNLFYPNPSVGFIEPNYLEHYYFIGRMLGKALYDRLMIELPLAEFFLLKLLSAHPNDLNLHHLASLDPELYKNLLFVKTYEGNVADLELTFSVVLVEVGSRQTIDLKPNGSQIPVTNSNRIEYIHLMADFKLNRQIYRQTVAFRRGLTDSIDLHWLHLFDATELQAVISGTPTPINVDDWRAHTTYGYAYSDDHPVIVCFWKVVHSLDEVQKRLLLKFATSCSRPPLMGFKELNPAFCINRVESTDRLPTAATCMNLLKLPVIEDFDMMREKILYAIEAGAGFELS